MFLVQLWSSLSHCLPDLRAEVQPDAGARRPLLLLGAQREAGGGGCVQGRRFKRPKTCAGEKHTYVGFSKGLERPRKDAWKALW